MSITLLVYESVARSAVREAVTASPARCQGKQAQDSACSQWPQPAAVSSATRMDACGFPSPPCSSKSASHHPCVGVGPSLGPQSGHGLKSLELGAGVICLHTKEQYSDPHLQSDSQPSDSDLSQAHSRANENVCAWFDKVLPI